MLKFEKILEIVFDKIFKRNINIHYNKKNEQNNVWCVIYSKVFCTRWMFSFTNMTDSTLFLSL